eukprot:TRINITY_DN31431_c0_g1_i1.p1 TRINITY_DN31431_c0_g1~~TRINITY_DN31431_c0_g1_i1.p1  ORF type:complete len:141 (-),score=23.24 TRINITY_DN31431_c0_g1_i1:23-445(-)
MDAWIGHLRAIACYCQGFSLPNLQLGALDILALGALVLAGADYLVQRRHMRAVAPHLVVDDGLGVQPPPSLKSPATAGAQAQAALLEESRKPWWREQLQRRQRPGTSRHDVRPRLHLVDAWSSSDRHVDGACGCNCTPLL